jgi:hypothetical protein
VFGIKKILIGFCVGMVFGLWFGVNLGKDQPIYSNPFHEASLKDRLVESGGNALEKGGQALKKSFGK